MAIENPWFSPFFLFWRESVSSHFICVHVLNHEGCHVTYAGAELDVIGGNMTS